MVLQQKLKQYLEDNGIQKKWMAKKLNVAPTYFSNILSGTTRVPPKHWRTLVELTKGYVTIHDILLDRLSEIELAELEIKKGEDKEHCIVSLK